MKEVADLLTTIWHSYASISKDWEGLLQDQEESLEVTSPSPVPPSHTPPLHTATRAIGPGPSASRSSTFLPPSPQGALESKEEEAAREVQALEGRLEEAHVRIDESARLLAARDREVESLRRQIDDLRRQLAAASTRRAASAERQQPAGAAQGEPAPPPADKAQRGDDGAAGRVESRASTGMSKGSRRGKEMTRSKVLEIVREIYKSKDRSDELFREGKQERETMEEHLYRFMNNKFGLRGLIIEHVESLLAGVQRFRDSAVEIALVRPLAALSRGVRLPCIDAPPLPPPPPLLPLPAAV